MPGGKLPDRSVNAIGRRNELTFEIKGHGVEVNITRHCRKAQKRLDFRTEDERSGVPREIQGFHAEVVAGEEQFAMLAIPYREREHSRDPFKQLTTPLAPTVNQYFAVAVRCENMAGVRELPP